ncbi:class II aldolase/adducin family protein [Dactylosporangium aurantiacum]|uniref:Class II aldolase/adducin family protein n=1 Tax=Dactylosporangium aurantiacum TaxID=35754 RepID=A0A9Q9IFS0_9ACTN|nr:class II aldolase/adducin family protein [Dactylosporangium aurantiacum]MDG6101328.1 class II aldolase/adducin family protein [Dactylosporangium aurantiacum]UWZ54666.1 class II aldolase/adducin family protein [Dactylosporangium aurantiacum]
MFDQADHLRDQLARLGQAVVQAGLVVGSGGNLSARAPGSDECWVTAAGTWLDRLSDGCFVRVRISDGTPLDTTGAPTSELGLHLATYRARPDANAIVHLHPQTVLLLDAIGEPIRLVTTDHAFYLRQVVTTPFCPPGDPLVGELAAAACADGVNCVVLSHHGCSVIADSVELAHKRALYLEEAAQLTYRALTLGRTPEPVPTGWLDRPSATV